MDENLSVGVVILTIAIVTAILRFLPFWIFSGRSKIPSAVLYLGRVLPYAIMGMLVVYCFKDISVWITPYGLHELIACVTVVLLHVWRRNSLLSIGVGTLCYMIVIRTL